MDFCFFIPVIFGCPTKIKQEGDGSARICPRCQNAQVVQAKARTWFELCWIPLIPMKSKHIYFCNICQWQADQDGGFQPQVAGGGFGGHQAYHQQQPQQYGYGPPQQQGYGYPPPKH
ncbi:uncharacterized protein UMAG_11133 [Mycosarcoma maydis]|uniref:Zinc-ribbon 15 domain-containing protein n=1 Tax=Mycosarcoma maydis TaxID=5270 RepID=A0A0D1DVH2_MYCMD|nr:uncharacterized protein UMAG_11133 [Ustilago maydis 521]KIS67721.1 hypothetical protein UMAG_11133 [Ustilago maydis 521]|eukprot:XP_011390814.1 hypothetical protein UMAG_11133 [Ustilago maydis 521]